MQALPVRRGAEPTDEDSVADLPQPKLRKRIQSRPQSAIHGSGLGRQGCSIRPTSAACRIGTAPRDHPTTRAQNTPGAYPVKAKNTTPSWAIGRAQRKSGSLNRDICANPSPGDYRTPSGIARQVEAKRPSSAVAKIGTAPRKATASQEYSEAIYNLSSHFGMGGKTTGYTQPKCTIGRSSRTGPKPATVKTPGPGAYHKSAKNGHGSGSFGLKHSIKVSRGCTMQADCDVCCSRESLGEILCLLGPQAISATSMT